MKGCITLTLQDLRFFAHHGWYEEETRQGQQFLVNLRVTYPEPGRAVQDLAGTIDYTTVFELLRRQMNTPRKLLEELAQSILSEIHQQFPQVSELQIHIQKVDPPVADLNGMLGIELRREY
ncbi:MAG: dihydroneopterin aldolase [Bacteroidota bacterium]